MATMANLFEYHHQDAGVDSISNLPVWMNSDAKEIDRMRHQSIDGSLSIRKGKYKLEMCPGSWRLVIS